MIPAYPVDQHRGAWTASCPACGRYRTPKKGSADKARRALHDHLSGKPDCAAIVTARFGGALGIAGNTQGGAS